MFDIVNLSAHDHEWLFQRHEKKKTKKNKNFQGEKDVSPREIEFLHHSFLIAFLFLLVWSCMLAYLYFLDLKQDYITNATTNYITCLLAYRPAAAAQAALGLNVVIPDCEALRADMNLPAYFVVQFAVAGAGT